MKFRFVKPIIALVLLIAFIRPFEPYIFGFEETNQYKLVLIVLGSINILISYNVLIIFQKGKKDEKN